MDAKKKADALIEKFKPLVCSHIFNYEIEYDPSIWAERTKQCAIIAVEEIIDELQHHSDLHGYYQDKNGRQSIVQRILFYQEVLEHLKKKL